MPRALGRLRWQLTLSHLIAIAFTLVSMIAAVVVIGSTWWSTQNAPAREPAQDARLVAQAVGGLVNQGEPAALSLILRGLVQGDVRLVAPAGPPNQRGGSPNDIPQLRNIDYIVVLGPDGRTLASSDPAADELAPAERQAWQPVAQRALSGTHDDIIATRPDAGWSPGESSSAGPAALGAAPIVDQNGQPLAAVLVAVSSVPADNRSAFAPLAAIGVASLVVLSASFVFALASSSLVAYLLSRRLVKRLEQLGHAAEALRRGKLDVRLPAGGTDEVAQLQRSFNAMATDLERTLHELGAERDRVAGLLEARRQLVAGVSHELRTPVATVRGYLESALRRDGTVSAELRADLETMQREIGRLQRLIEDLFLLARSEVGQLELRLQPTDVGVLARRLVDTQAPLAWRQRRVELVVQASAPLPLAWVDAQRLEQILGNLVSNAVRHTPPGGLVAVAVAAQPPHLRVEVRDTGEGIDPADLPRVFERFYRGGTGAPGGAGLGLALVKELTEAMGGTVSVASTPGEGTSFTVCLPLSETDVSPLAGTLQSRA